MNVVITGTGKGIGFELAKIFLLKNDAHVFAISRNQKNILLFANSLNTELREKLHIFSFDLNSNKAAFNKLATEITSYGKVDILINNAGLLINKPFIDLTNKDFDNTINTNLKACFSLIQTLTPYMSVQSHIVNISSMGGYQGSVKFPGLSIYSASKGALAILTECLAEELKQYKIAVNCLALGAVQTEMLSKAFPKYNAPVNANEMACYIADFSISGHKYYNGKILPVSLSTP